MKLAIMTMVAVLFTLSGFARADSPYGALQTVHEKNTILKDLRKLCSPKGSPSDDAWEKTIMSTEGNQLHIREAIVAMERNNQNNYWEALGKVECPDM